MPGYIHCGCDLWAVGCCGGHGSGAKANSASSVEGLKPLRVLMTQGMDRSPRVLHPSPPPLLLCVAFTEPGLPLSPQLNRDPGI